MPKHGRHTIAHLTVKTLHVSPLVPGWLEISPRPDHWLTENINIIVAAQPNIYMLVGKMFVKAGNSRYAPADTLAVPRLTPPVARYYGTHHQAASQLNL
eukprot:3170738-Pleurochrysis_carterae.AAC.1